MQKSFIQQTKSWSEEKEGYAKPTKRAATFGQVTAAELLIRSYTSLNFKWFEFKLVKEYNPNSFFLSSW